MQNCSHATSCPAFAQRASRFKMKLIVRRRSEVAFAEAFMSAMETGKGIVSLSPGATSGNVISP